MTILTANNASQLNILQTIELCKTNQSISTNRYKELLLELKYLSKNLVLKFNHKKSSSISKENYTKVIDTISYYVNHSLFNADDLGIENIEFYYTKGQLEINHDNKEIKNIHEQLLKHRLRINNERYNSILDEQVPRFLKTLDTYRGEFCVCHTNEDLDYPLIDGLPLDHDMYGSDGTDLVRYYLTRFKIENDFCFLFGKQVNELIKMYEVCKDIEIELLNINICELCLIQYVANRMMMKDDLLLSQSENNMIKMYATRYHLKIEEIFKEMFQMFSKEIGLYLNLFKKTIESQFEMFYQEDTELLVYEKIVDEKFNVILTETDDSTNFTKLLDNLRVMNEIKDRIRYLTEYQVGLLDLLDLFENDIFYNDEYLLYYQSCTSDQLALFVKVAIPDIGKFNMKIKLDERCFSELDKSIPWQNYLIQHLKTLDNSRLQEIETILSKIKLTIL
ncbi:DUF6179 domain-containing protein [Anaerorhabdus sp.]|uniref:DUF6179 domain-containing protein n=1 Tax=Anaerorhabdus sp. TaxID=1872524 RepID=UPI002FCC9DDC